jgi:hypothetical protein
MASDQQGDGAAPTSALELVAKISAVVASLGLIVSVFYDWGFLFALGLSFADAPTTVADHVRSWLVWLPKVATAVLALLIFELFIRRMEKGMTEQEIVESSSNPELIAKIRRGPLILIGASAVVLVVSWILLGPAYLDGMFFGLGICWFIFVGWVFRHPRVRDRHTAGFRFAVYWGFPILMWIFSSGFNDARVAASSTETPQKLHLKTSIGMDGAYNVLILRSFEHWLLVQDKNRSVLWLRTDDVLRIEGAASTTRFQGVLCHFSEIWCGAGPTRSGK